MADIKNILANLNPQQRKAVETLDGPVLVVAGPGTG
jgi:DNA helicase-2/ATP-dependent DNA helicase PcrA